MSAQTWRDSIIVLPVKIAAPADAKKLGNIKVGNNAVKTRCDYEEMVKLAKEKARAMGGNIVKITKLLEPAFISKCYKIEADVYHADKLPVYDVKRANENKATPANNNYAVLYIYRLPDTLALITPYKLHLNDDSVISIVKSKSADSAIINKEGMITLWAETGKRTELKLDVKSGQAYYIRCGLQKGEIRMIPVLQLMDNDTGAEEYGKLKKRKKDIGVNYLYQIH